MLEQSSRDWDHKVAAKTGWCHFMQSAEWASVQTSGHWQAELSSIDDLPVTTYRRRAWIVGRVYQIPKIAQLLEARIGSFTDEFRQLAKGAVALKLDIDHPFDERLHHALLKRGWKRMPSGQYQETVLVDLTMNREELLASFKKRARWELNAGVRRGVKVEKLEVTKQNMDLVYDLLRKTYDRAGFITRSRSFTEKYWREFAAAGHGSIYLASLEGKPLAAAYVIHIGVRAFYKDGASIRTKPDVFASRVMQGQIIQDLKEQGIKTYDLCGMSTEAGSDIAGVSLFKTGFGEPVKLQGGYELPLSNWRYKLWKRVVERVLIKYSMAVRKEIWY